MTIATFQPVQYRNQRPGTANIQTIQSKSPAVNISEDDKAFYIRLATPGMSRSDFNIQLEGNRLIVKGTDDKEKNQSQFSFIWRDFEKSFLISDKVETDLITAESKDGILSIILPKNDKVLTVKVS